jgi:hypothetical protein
VGIQLLEESKKGRKITLRKKPASRNQPIMITSKTSEYKEEESVM